MMAPELLGALIVGIPALLIAYLAQWRRQRPVFWFALALIVVGVGYLAATGATADIANFLLDEAPMPVETPAP
jgi:uncharacterized membrane protein